MREIPHWAFLFLSLADKDVRLLLIVSCRMSKGSGQRAIVEKAEKINSRRFFGPNSSKYHFRRRYVCAESSMRAESSIVGFRAQIITPGVTCCAFFFFFFWVDPSAFVFAPVIANERRRTLRKRERNGRKSRFPLLCVLQLFFLPSAQSHMALNYEAHWAYTMAHSRLR